MIENVSSDIYNEHVAEVMEACHWQEWLLLIPPQHASPRVGICAQKCRLMTPYHFMCASVGKSFQKVCSSASYVLRSSSVYTDLY